MGGVEGGGGGLISRRGAQGEASQGICLGHRATGIQ